MFLEKSKASITSSILSCKHFQSLMPLMPFTFPTLLFLTQIDLFFIFPKKNHPTSPKKSLAFAGEADGVISVKLPVDSAIDTLPQN